MRIAFFVALITCCVPTWSHAGVEGSYAIDLPRLIAQMKAGVKKLPKRRQAFAKMGIAMIQSMKFRLTLASHGKATSFMSMKVFGKLKTKQGQGTWKQGKAGELLLMLHSTDNQGNRVTDKLLCKPAPKSQLACKNISKNGSKKNTLYFKKTGKN